jgi:hypothetical protein
MKHTRLVVRLTGLGEAQAEGVVAVLALVLLAFGATLVVHWGRRYGGHPLLQGSLKCVNRALVVNCVVVNGYGVRLVRP